MATKSRGHLSPVATCRQTVEALLAPLSTAWERMATRSRSQLSPVATCRQTVEALLAPLPPLGSGWLRFGETLRNFDGDFRIELIDQIGPSSQRDWICDTSREAKLAKRKRYLPSEMKNLKQLGKDDGFGVPKRYTTLYEHPESNKSKRWDL